MICFTGHVFQPSEGFSLFVCIVCKNGSECEWRGDLALTCRFNVESGKFLLSFRPCCNRRWMSMEKRSKFSRDAVAYLFGSLFQH